MWHRKTRYLHVGPQLGVLVDADAVGAVAVHQGPDLIQQLRPKSQDQGKQIQNLAAICCVYALKLLVRALQL